MATCQSTGMGSISLKPTPRAPCSLLVRRILILPVPALRRLMVPRQTSQLNRPGSRLTPPVTATSTSPMKIFVVDLGPDRLYGTRDDKVTSFSTTAFGDQDPEGIAFGQGNLFVTSGSGGTPGLYQLAPGANGRFDGVPSAGDDVVVRHFTTSGFGLTDPEGITFNSDTNTLYIVGHLDKHLVETTITGTLLNQIDITSLDVCAPSDVVYAPSSLNPAVKHLYISERGVDNNDNRFANDGEVYEISLDPAECALLPQN